MVKKLPLIAFIMVILVGISFFGIKIYDYFTDYGRVLKINWQITLPNSAKLKEIYQANTETDFHGDGLRYHIFSYQEEDSIKKMLNWTTDEQETIFCSSYQECINNWLGEMKVAQENYPNLRNCEYWYNRQDDSSEIIILWDNISHKLYIIESFL